MTGAALPPSVSGLPPHTCAACGQASPAMARFCSNCGNPLAGPAAKAATTVTASPAPVTSTGAERRRVTVLFGDLVDFTGWAEDLDPELVGVVTDRVLAVCAAAVVDHGGTVDKLTGDGIMAVFGAPTAHEDDAERAVAAAIAMQADVRAAMADALGDRALGELAEAAERSGRLGLRVGLNTGMVLAGVQAALSYTVVGDTVNTASRLSDAAGVGAILAGRETASATMHMASWRALPALVLKGKRGVVPAYELVELRDPLLRVTAPGEEAPLVGRTDELGRLIGVALDAIEVGRPCSVVLMGEAGAGKTRLLAELSRFCAEIPGSRVLWGRCAPYGVGRELAPVVDIVRSALGLDDAPPAELRGQLMDALERLEGAAGMRAPRLADPGLADHILGLLGVHAAGTGPGGLPASAARREHPRLEAELDAAASVLRLLAGQGPLIIIIDDLQWATAPLEATLVDLAARLDGPVLIAGAGRAGDGGGDGWWLQLPAPTVVEVPPLSDADIEMLLRSHLGGAAVDAEVRSLLLGRAQGNPFYLEELLHLLFDQGKLERGENGEWVILGDLPGELLPVGVQALLAARLDAVDAPSKAVLRDAAVLGARVPLSGLAALAEGQAADLQVAVEDLLRRRLLVRLPEDEDVFVFGHALTRDVAYAAIPKGERALLHAAAAGWASSTARGTDTDQLIATHADRAVVLASEMALSKASAAWSVRLVGSQAYDRLARAALGRDDHRTAVKLLSRAIELGQPVATSEQLLLLGVALAGELSALFRFEEAEAALTAPLASADVTVSGRAKVVLGDVRRKQGREAQATQAWVSAFALASEAGLDGIAGEAIRNLGLQDYFAGRLVAAEERFRHALQLARRVQDPRGAGWALQHLAWSRTSRGAFDDADAALTEAAEVFASLGDVGGLSWCAGTEALVRVLQGRFTECRALMEVLVPAAEESGDRWGIAACRTIDALAAAELGQPELARQLAEQASADFAEVADPWGTVLALASLGIALRGLGRFAEAAEVLQRAVGTAENITAPLTAMVALVALGQVALDAQDLPGADQASARAQDLLSRIELAPGARVAVVVLLAQVRRAHGDLAGSLALLEDVAATDHRDVVLFPQRQTLAHLAGVRLELGDVAGARNAVELSLVTPAEDVRSRVIALRALGSVRRAEGDDRGARAAWQEAMAVAQSSGQVSERAATQRLLDSRSSRTPQDNGDLDRSGPV